MISESTSEWLQFLLSCGAFILAGIGLDKVAAKIKLYFEKKKERHERDKERYK